MYACYHTANKGSILVSDLFALSENRKYLEDLGDARLNRHLLWRNKKRKGELVFYLLTGLKRRKSIHFWKGAWTHNRLDDWYKIEKTFEYHNNLTGNE